MELSLRTTLAAQVEGDSSVVVPGKLLVDLARLLPAAEVTIEYRPEDGVAHISSGSYSSKLNVFSAEDFPRLPSVDPAPHTIATASLLETVDRVARSASKDESRPVLTGIQVRFEGTQLFMAATDSYRLSFKETELEQSGPDLEAIIPARALTELARIASGTETVALGVNENTVVFGTGDTWLTTRRIDGQFPDVGRLLPESFEVEVDLPRAELRDVVRRAGVMALRNAPLRLRFAEGELTISAQSQDVGETVESLPAAYTGEPLEIGFNAEFLADGVDCGAQRHRAAEADQPAPARPDHVRRRRLVLVPDHADQARRLIVAEVTLRDFRSYARLELSLEPGLVLVTGANGAGKTNLLESLHVGTQGFSPRTRSDMQLIRQGATAGRVELTGRRGTVPVAVSVSLSATEPKRARLDGAVLRSAEQLRGELATLVFTPDRLVVVKGGPAARRAYLDRSLGRLYPARGHVSLDYAAAVGQRNAALRRVALGVSERDVLAPWTAQVADLGAMLTAARRDVIELLQPGFAERAGELGLADVSLGYDAEPPTITLLEERLARDIERGSTGAGPHLDEIAIRSRRPRPAHVRLAGRAAPRRSRAPPRRGGADRRPPPRAAAPAPRRRALGARREQAPDPE